MCNFLTFQIVFYGVRENSSFRSAHIRFFYFYRVLDNCPIRNPFENTNDFFKLRMQKYLAKKKI